MKSLTKLFMAVTVLFASFACTTDVTKDVGVELQCQTDIILSLEEARTHISDKVGDEYPLYWSEGDKIAVNGIASEPLSESDHGKASAKFSISGDLTYPYNIVYPAPAEGLVAAEGMQVVTFPTVQNYTVGSFAEGAVPMYAYVAAANEQTKLQHLAGILCFAIKGEGKTLTSMTLKSESGAIAGNFDLNCADGSLTAQTNAANIVTLSFGEGLTLGAEATPIYVTVPAGDYGIFAVTLNTATDRMSIRFDSEGAKAVKAGVVREFTEFEYAANVAEDGAFLIESKEDLIQLAKIASNFEPYTSAKVVANIDMTDYDWTPIEGFDSAFDGGNFEIKGLTAPLFDETAATEIKNVKLVDVNIVDENVVKNSDGYYCLGALARRITGSKAVVENCSVSGNINLAWASTPKDVNLYVGAIVGVSNSTKEHSNLTNSANIEISGKLGHVLYCSGVVCHAKDGAITNATNLGNINFTGESAITLRLSGITFICPTLTNCVNGSADAKQEKGAITVSGTLTGGVRVGALMPELDALKNTINITDCNNYGAFTINCPTTLSEVQSGGLLGLNSNDARTVNIANSHNYGNITISSNLKGNIRMSGIVGNVTGSTYVLTECSNHGDLSFDGTSAGEIRLAGMVAALGGGGSVKVIDGYTNTGNIDLGENTCCTGTNIQIGGIAANYSGSINSASTGVIKNAGNISYKENATNAKITRVGGIIAAANKEFNFDNASFVNEGNITVVGNSTGHELTVGGIYGNGSKTINNARCYCNLITTNASVVGMIMAGNYSSKYPATSCHIGGSISKKGGEGTPITIDNYTQYIYNNTIADETAVNTHKCGWLASKDADPELKFIPGQEISSADELIAFAAQVAENAALAENVALTADIDMTGKEWTPIEGYAGTFNGGNFEIKGLTAPFFGTTQASIQNLKLTDVNIETTEAKTEYAVLAGKIDSASAVVKNCSVSGKMKINPTMTASITDEDIVIAGLIGVTSSSAKFSNLVNEVNIEISGTFKNNIIAAGLLGAGESSSLSNSTNLGTITFNGTSAGNHVFVGGLVVQCKEVIDCVNGSASDESHAKGSLTIDGKTKNAYAAGFAPTVRSNISLVRCHNYGAITYTENATTGGATILGGAIGYCSPSTAIVTFNTCANYAPITVDGSTIGGDLKVGGLIGHYGGNSNLKVLNGYTNAGEINIAPKSVAASKSVQIGGMIGNFSASFSTESTGRLHNKGNITYSGASSSGSAVRVAGILAAMAKNPPTDLELVNTGNLTSTGTGKTVNVGGIVGAGKSVENAICYCNIKAVNATGIGWIIANARTSSITAKNCQIGGNIVSYDDEEEKEKIIPMAETDFFNYIYSSGADTDWSGTTNYDGCTFLSTQPVIQ